MAADDPRVSGIAVRKVTTADDKSKVTLAIEITGDHFGPATTPVTVKLVDMETNAEVPATVIAHDNNLIRGTVEVPIAKKPVKYHFVVAVNNRIAQVGRLADYTLEVGKEERKEDTPKPFEITFETFKSTQYPNLHSLVITNKTAEAKSGFLTNPALMKVDIVPAGATNLAIQTGSSPYQMFVTFLAPETFEVKGVNVTVFEPDSTLADNRLRSFSTPFKPKEPKANPNQPTISAIEILSMQRRSGYGRVRIVGDGFGDYERPPVTGDKELLCCLNRPSNPEISDEQVDRQKRGRQANAYAVADSEVCSLVTAKCNLMSEWRQRIENRINVTLMPRNPDFRIERTQVLYIDDKVIDMYFEFTRYDEYSIPFRLENATVTVNKGGVKESRTTDDAGAFSAVLLGPQTFVARKDIGAPRDQNLEYRYTVLNPKDATQLFGGGVGKNFFVIELSVVNNGKKKMAVPLGSIQAEAAWMYGDEPKGDVFFQDGPPTLPALPLGAVSGYFDAFQKSKGRWAKIFNTLEGVGTLAATMVPVIGELERPGLILSSGLIPGLRRSIGDLSSEQLQRLTSMSWENVEEIPAGGSKSKFIYIPRADQFFGGTAQKVKRNDKDYKLVKRVMDLTGLEVAGFEITESEKKQATEQSNESSESPLPE